MIRTTSKPACRNAQSPRGLDGGEAWAWLNGNPLHADKLRHPGPIAFDFTHLWLGPQAGPRMTPYTPADAISSERLDRLYAHILAERTPAAV